MNSDLQIEAKYFPAISKFFSSIVVDSLIANNKSPFINEVCLNSELLKNVDTTITVGEFFDYAYNLLLKSYKNEYVFKNVLIHKILLGKHSLNTSQMLMEFRVDNCKADVVLLNGSSTVYEIKSEYDSMNRLEGQVRAYRDAFDFIYVITSEKQIEKVNKIVNDDIGILLLTDRNTISTYREAKSNIHNIKLPVLFDSMRKVEYIQIIKNYYGYIPQVPNTQINRICKELFCSIPTTKAHQLWVEVLKKRNRSISLNSYIMQAPHSMGANLINIGYKAEQIKKLSKLFNENLQNIIHLDLTKNNEICTTPIYEENNLN